MLKKCLIGLACLKFTLLSLALTSSESFAKDYSEWLIRCEPYRDSVTKILNEEGVNSDYYYLMVAESKCTEKAKSNKGAIGFWQLMPATSKHYGCNNPYNVECATRAAARYIKHLSNTFKRFEDVIAAYNIGGHNYKRNGITNEAIGLVIRVKQIKDSD